MEGGGFGLGADDGVSIKLSRGVIAAEDACDVLIIFEHLTDSVHGVLPTRE